MRLLARSWMTLLLTWTFCALLVLGGAMFGSNPSLAQPPTPTEPTVEAPPDEPTQVSVEQAPAGEDAADGADQQDADADEAITDEANGNGKNGDEQPKTFSKMLTTFWESLNLDTLWVDNTLLNWGVLLGAIFAGIALGKIASVILQRIGRQLDRVRYSLQAQVFSEAAGPANLALIAIGIQIGLQQLSMSIGLRDFVDNVIALLIYIAIFWYTFNLVSIIEVLLKRFTARTRSDLDDMVIPMIRKTLRIFIVIIAFLLIAENVFQQDIAAWLAGLGIAGLAVSLAAQDSLKNIFGSITIFLDHPFKVGDRINYAGHDGPVEKIVLNPKP